MKFSEWGYNAWKFNADHIRTRLDRTILILERILADGIEYDAVAVMGTSGSWLAPLLTLEGHNVVLIRKPGEYSHGDAVEGPSGLDIKRLVVVDDLISTGKTIDTIMERLDEFVKARDWMEGSKVMKVVAVALHDQYHDEERSHRLLPVYGYRD